MVQTLVSLLVHMVFSTENRSNTIKSEVEPELHAYMGGVLKDKWCRALTVNGTANHVHLLVSMTKNLPLSSVVGELKKSSSKWIKTKGGQFRGFDWQDGYGAFSIGQSGVEALKEYIANQKERHKRQSFDAEFVQLLRKYGIEYNEEYLWG